MKLAGKEGNDMDIGSVDRNMDEFNEFGMAGQAQKSELEANCGRRAVSIAGKGRSVCLVGSTSERTADSSYFGSKNV